MADETERALAELASLSWKLCAALEREAAFADPDRAQGTEAMLRFSRRKLESLLAGQNMQIATFEGAHWTADIPASPVNHDEAQGGTPIVDTTIEPTVMVGSEIILPGKIMLRCG